MTHPILQSPEISEFQNSAVLRETLKEELKLPGISAALKAISSSIKPRSIPASIPGNHPDTAIAHQFYRLFGVQQVLSTLEALAMVKGKHPLDNFPDTQDFAQIDDPRYRDPKPPSERDKT